MQHTLREALKHVYTAGLASVDPEAAVLRALDRRGNVLRVAGHSLDLSSVRKVFLVGFGKAAVPMARAVETVLGDRLEEGFIIVKYGHGGELRRTRVAEAGHPEPDLAGETGARTLLGLVDNNVSERDLLIVVVSGGGSALAPAPIEGVTLEDKQKATALLLRSGATIHEINAIRKHLSRIKGGRLLKHANGATVFSLLLSDVVGDDLSTIASGPTAPDPTTFADALGIIHKYGLEEKFPRAILDCLRSGVREESGVTETLKAGDPAASRAWNVVVGSNVMALRAAAEEAHRLGFTPLILSSSFQGDTAEAAGLHVAIVREVLATGHPLSPPCCLISGGETTVRVRGKGKGGRNQEFVLWCAREIAGWKADVIFASLGSDGNDGPTDAAGAVADPGTVGRAARLGLSIDDYLARNDSYNFFKPLNDLIVTGPTRTNVMDLRLVLVAS